ncbi:MAG: glycosyltransferase family 4 protein [Planctomycetaceae bacterium]
MTQNLLISGERSNVTLIANPYSVHVERWLKLFRLARIDVRIETAERPGLKLPVSVPVEFLAPAWLSGPLAVRYLWAGVAASRKRRPPGELLHAHCTSGSGFTAWLSGHPYLVTTYGSEIFGAADRGRLYRWIIRRILHGALRVTATTPRMAETLQQDFGVPADRIRTFSLGYDSDLFVPASDDARRRLRSDLELPIDERIWVINRRSLPLYRTLEVVTGFLNSCEHDHGGCLVVLSGDDDPAYTRQVRSLIAGSPYGTRVRLIREFLPAEDVAAWLQAADFAVSVPKTDQLSTSILEAMACGAVPVLSDLDAYRPLHTCPAVQRIQDCSAEGFARTFARLAAMSETDLMRNRQLCAEFVGKHYAETSILNEVRALFGLPPLGARDQNRAA